MTVGSYDHRLQRGHPTPLIFLDESGSIAGDRFFVVGVLKLSQPSRLLRRIQRFRDREGWYGEFHFAQVTKGSVELYKRLVDLVSHEDGLWFDCFVADKALANPVERWETHWRAYEKLAEQLLVGSIRPFEIVSVLADNYSTPPEVDFESTVTERVNKRLDRLAVANLIRIDSASTDGLQIVDLLTSAVGFEFRQAAGIAGRGNPKDALAGNVRDRFGVGQPFTAVPLKSAKIGVRLYEHGAWNPPPGRRT
jgi:hypothetical protein